jgi:hypothetical protein
MSNTCTINSDITDVFELSPWPNENDIDIWTEHGINYLSQSMWALSLKQNTRNEIANNLREFLKVGIKKLSKNLTRFFSSFRFII